MRGWLAALVYSGTMVVLPEIIDYEHRRKTLHTGSTSSIRYLDALKQYIAYAPLTTEVMLRAARLWAEARSQGLPTASEERLDVDVILAAQALELAEGGDEVIVATAATHATSPDLWTPAAGERSSNTPEPHGKIRGPDGRYWTRWAKTCLKSLPYLRLLRAAIASSAKDAPINTNPGTRNGAPKPNDAARRPPPRGPRPNAAEVTDAATPNAAP